MALIHENITKSTIGAAFEVYRILGYGFLERVYQKAMQVELSQNGLQAELEQPIKIRFKGAIVGDYYADPFVEGKVIVSIRV
jgi:GxxExxY protein